MQGAAGRACSALLPGNCRTAAGGASAAGQNAARPLCAARGAHARTAAVTCGMTQKMIICGSGFLELGCRVSVWPCLHLPPSCRMGRGGAAPVGVAEGYDHRNPGKSCELAVHCLSHLNGRLAACSKCPCVATSCGVYSGAHCNAARAASAYIPWLHGSYCKRAQPRRLQRHRQLSKLSFRRFKIAARPIQARARRMEASGHASRQDMLGNLDSPCIREWPFAPPSRQLPLPPTRQITTTPFPLSEFCSCN